MLLQFEKASVYWEVRIFQRLLSYALVLPNIARLEYSYGANKQKIKKLDPCNCNVRANKNAGKAFSMQRYLYRCKGLIFLFSFVQYMKCNMQRYLYRCNGLNFLFSLVSCMK